MVLNEVRTENVNQVNGEKESDRNLKKKKHCTMTLKSFVQRQCSVEQVPLLQFE